MGEVRGDPCLVAPRSPREREREREERKRERERVRERERGERERERRERERESLEMCTQTRNQPIRAVPVRDFQPDPLSCVGLYDQYHT